MVRGGQRTPTGVGCMHTPHTHRVANRDTQHTQNLGPNKKTKGSVTCVATHCECMRGRSEKDKDE